MSDPAYSSSDVEAAARRWQGVHVRLQSDLARLQGHSPR